jgi:ATP-dependent Lon protease
VDLSYYKDSRKSFDLEEWVDLLIRSMEYNPEGFESFSQKLLFISRLLVFVEPNLNIIELAPKGTGKSYVFNNLTKYGWLISGGVVTRAKLLYDMSRQVPGIITRYDFVAFDEIETIKFSDENELQGALKNYLEAGNFSVGNFKGVSPSGVILLGNLPLTKDKMPIHNEYFYNLPIFFKSSALLDRFHGFIEGWKLPKVHENLKLKGYTLNVEYFSEILHSLRTVPDYSNITEKMLSIPPTAYTRDTNAIKKICTAYLKLLFPHIEDASSINKEEFENLCLLPAKRMRGIIRKQMSIIDSEYSEELPDIQVV